MINKWCNEKLPNNTNFNSYDFLKTTFGCTIKDWRTLYNHQFYIGIPYECAAPYDQSGGFRGFLCENAAFPLKMVQFLHVDFEYYWKWT